ncbi:MAG: DUF1553 domain-containing protein, partial [Saprospiraceae bacterium]|nr:DUF1553 domain-containing protein [Saprospiraceae bacterium]
PILADKCFSCHGPDENKLEAGLRLDVERIAKGFLPENPGKRAIDAGSPMQSQVVHRILSEDAELKMPPEESNLTLSSQEKAVIIKWIEEGAKYKPHWAFIPPQRSTVPESVNPVDYFVGLHLKQQGLTPSGGADKETLLRRLSFDLTGLPPTIEAMDDFLNDESKDAYEKQVDRFLASPHYGERMATGWMDVARYADTHGYTVDRYRDVSPWRDWVIESFNANMPYDQFFTTQLAGDLLPNAGKKEKIATAFLRLHPQNMEGGIVPEEFRIEYVVDRTNTFGTAFMGMTMGCAKCHDHKFDPISQKEYFRLFSFFNNLREAGQISFDNMMPVPTLLLTDEKQDSIIAYLNSKIEAARHEVDKIDTEEIRWIESESYQKITESKSEADLIGFYPLENHLRNMAGNAFHGEMQRNNSDDEKPSFTEGKEGKGLILDGDAWLDLGGIAAYDRYHSFSIGISVKLPPDLKNGVIFHKGIGAALYNFKGLHLALRENKLELLMAHTMPYNAIVEYADVPVPRNQWVEFFITYDGSSQASGLRVFMDGVELITQVEHDKLYKGILFGHGNTEPGIQVGARWRGKGIGGAIVDNIRIYKRDLTSLEVMFNSDPGRWLAIKTKPYTELSESDQALLIEYYYRLLHKGKLTARHQWLQWQRERSQYVEEIPELMVYEEMPQPRPTFVLDRGAYDSPAERVYPAPPAAILAVDSNDVQDRLQLARWLANPNHPLTARVMINRLWQQFFGKGLVVTAEDFGNQGSNPTHPALLDHLAVLFRENGWNIKQMQKLIVTSSTYRQSSVANAKLLELDPENKWYARGPSQRLSAEMLRDQALAGSVLLNARIGGPSVRPYQPDGLWRVNGAEYVPSTGDDLYRRSLYTIWKRSVPHPTQSTFDAPERSECVMRRQETNTPLQALVLMNDPIYIEAAREIGVQMARQDNIETAFRKLCGRHPRKEEVSILRQLFESELEKFQDTPEKATGWLDRKSVDHKELREAAYAVVASTIINSDAFITKR